MRLTTTNQALLVVGVLTFFLAVTTSVILAVAEAKTMKSKPCHYECSLLKYFFPRFLVVFSPAGGCGHPASGVCGPVDCSVCTHHT